MPTDQRPAPALEYVTALARGLDVLRVLNDQRRPLTLSETARLAGLPRAAARRSLHTLQQTGYVEFDGRSYRPSLLTLQLGAGAIQAQPFAEAARPVLQDASRATGESCSVSVLTGASITYLARVSTSRIMSVNIQVGTRLPAFCSSMGRVLLAQLPPDELEAFLASRSFEAYTERTLTDPGALRAELRAVSRQGYALVDQELEDGLRSVAVPITNLRGEVRAAINAGANAASKTLSDLEAFIPHLRAAADRLSGLSDLNH